MYLPRGWQDARVTQVIAHVQDGLDGRFDIFGGVGINFPFRNKELTPHIHKQYVTVSNTKVGASQGLLKSMCKQR
jgi:hypothetical protein